MFIFVAIYHFPLIAALKITWLRRYILQHNSTWSSLSNIDMNGVFSKGENYEALKTKKLTNPFWKDILKSWKHFCQLVEFTQTLEDILNSRLWLKTHIAQGQNMYISEWYDKGITNIIDLINLDGIFNQLDELKEKYNVHGTF